MPILKSQVSGLDEKELMALTGDNNLAAATLNQSLNTSRQLVDKIQQSMYAVPNYNTKINLLILLLSNREVFSKVMVFAKAAQIRRTGTMRIVCTNSVGYFF